MDAVSKALDAFLEEKVEPSTILLIEENGFTPIAAHEDVIHCTGRVNSSFPSHGPMLY